MKLFSCFNRKCPSHNPGNARDNHVMQAVLVLTALDEEGNPMDGEHAVKAVNQGYECGLCGAAVQELTIEKAVNCKLSRVTGTHIIGVFTNAFRGDAAFNFAVNLGSGEVLVKENIQLHPDEERAIREFCLKEYYENGIRVEITDAGHDVVECLVRNLVDRTTITVTVQKGEVVDQNGMRDLLPIEKKKVLEVVSESGFGGA